MTGVFPDAARRVALPAGVLVLSAALVAYVAADDPSEAGHYPSCPFLR